MPDRIASSRDIDLNCSIFFPPGLYPPRMEGRDLVADLVHPCNTQTVLKVFIVCPFGACTLTKTSNWTGIYSMKAWYVCPLLAEVGQYEIKIRSV